MTVEDKIAYIITMHNLTVKDSEKIRAITYQYQSENELKECSLKSKTVEFTV